VSTPSIRVRRATPTGADVDTLRGLAAAIWQEYYPAIIGPAQIEYMLATMYAADVIRREMAEGVTWEIVTAADSGEAVGYLSSSSDPAAAVLHLHKLYLVPRLHGQGLGRRLLDRVRKAAVRAEARTIRLQVNKRNARAIRAYERAPFRIADAVVCDIGAGFVMDDSDMTLSLEG
jgi:ribosomal protein S18 acetylase RimI-like enzyme